MLALHRELFLWSRTAYLNLDIFKKSVPGKKVESGSKNNGGELVKVYDLFWKSKRTCTEHSKGGVEHKSMLQVCYMYDF